MSKNGRNCKENIAGETGLGGKKIIQKRINYKVNEASKPKLQTKKR